MKSRNFNPSGSDKKLSCSCGCGLFTNSVATFLILEDLRRVFGVIIITSGARCLEYNEKVGGAKNSRHTYQDAVDLYARDHSIDDVYDYLINHPCADLLGIAKGKNFIHVDTRGSKARWTY